MTEAGTRLNTMIEKIIALEQYQPGYPNWIEQHPPIDPKTMTIDPKTGKPDPKTGKPIRPPLPAVPGASKTTTWCNEAANAVLLAMGFDTSPILNTKGIGWTNAKDMHDNAVAMSLSAPSGVLEITGRRAQAWANMGIPVLAAAVAKKGSSHVGIVAPSDTPFNLSAGPWIGQAGAVNGFRSAFDSFQKWGLSAPRYFLLPPKTA